MDRKQHLQEYLMKQLRYNTQWHPTILSYQAHKASIHGLFELYDDRHNNTVKKLLSSEKIPLERIMKQHEGNPYRFVHLQRKQRTHYLLAEEFTYWAEQQIPLLILDATGEPDHSVRIVTKCLPANLPLGPFKAYPKEFIVSYLLGDQNVISKLIKPMKVIISQTELTVEFLEDKRILDELNIYLGNFGLNEQEVHAFWQTRIGKKAPSTDLKFKEAYHSALNKLTHKQLNIQIIK